MYSNIKVYQKYLVTSIKVGCATRSLYASSGPKAEGVPTNNQRGRGSGPCRLWGGLDKARHIVPTACAERHQTWVDMVLYSESTRPENRDTCIHRHFIIFLQSAVEPRPDVGKIYKKKQTYGKHTKSSWKQV